MLDVGLQFGFFYLWYGVGKRVYSVEKKWKLKRFLLNYINSIPVCQVAHIFCGKCGLIFMLFYRVSGGRKAWLQNLSHFPSFALAVRLKWVYSPALALALQSKRETFQKANTLSANVPRFLFGFAAPWHRHLPFWLSSPSEFVAKTNTWITCVCVLAVSYRLTAWQTVK